MRNMFHMAASKAKQKAKLLSTLIVGLILGGAGSAVVMAAIPDVGGVIHGCRITATGLLRAIDTEGGETCRANEVALTWNQTGPQGPVGPQGPAGPAGVGGSGFVENIAGADFTGANLQYRDLRNLDFHGANFKNATIWGSDFRGSNLSGVSFDSTKAKGANFSGTDLSGSTFNTTMGANMQADLTDANLSGSNLTGAVFETYTSTKGANLQNANLTNATFKWGVSGGDLRGATLTGMSVGTPGTPYSNAGFDSVNVSGLDLSVVTFNGTINFGSSDLTNANFIGINLSNSTFWNDDASGANFTGINFTNAKIAKVIANNTNFSGANFTGTKFYEPFDRSSTDLSTAILTNVTWSNTTCPDNTNSDANGGTCLGHLTPQ